MFLQYSGLNKNQQFSGVFYSSLLRLISRRIMFKPNFNLPLIQEQFELLNSEKIRVPQFFFKQNHSEGFGLRSEDRF